LLTLNLGCSFIALRESCNNQRSRCDIAWFHVAIHLSTDFRVKQVKQSHASRSIF